MLDMITGNRCDKAHFDVNDIFKLPSKAATASCSATVRRRVHAQHMLHGTPSLRRRVVEIAHISRSDFLGIAVAKTLHFFRVNYEVFLKAHETLKSRKKNFKKKKAKKQ